jgi:hypothetical protein
MKKLIFILVMAALLAGGTVAAMSGPSQAQVYPYPPPPNNIYAMPWVGSNTPWVFYNGDWFLNGIMYYFFGTQYGWAPYYAYPPIYIVRPETWYAPRWRAWYVGHPRYYETFVRKYPYWRNHRIGERYNREFYERHHRGQGGGWQKGFQGRVIETRPHPEGHRPGPARMVPPEGHFKPGPAQVVPPEGRGPSPARVAPPGPARVAPEGHRHGPAQVTPREGQTHGPARVAPPEGRKPGPAPASGKKAPAGKPEKTGHGEEKH